jgi:hypothetical protein
MADQTLKAVRIQVHAFEVYSKAGDGGGMR